jgi:hypothetical protein
MYLPTILDFDQLPSIHALTHDLIKIKIFTCMGGLSKLVMVKIQTFGWTHGVGILL